jgi:tubulin-specific chaperone A
MQKQYQRLVKEVEYYNQEVCDNEAQLKEMKLKEADPYDIKRFEQVLGESYMMVPDSSKRLLQALEDLAAFLAAHPHNDDEEVEEVKNTSTDPPCWYSIAKEIMQKHSTKSDMPSGSIIADDAVVETIVDDLEDGEAF